MSNIDYDHLSDEYIESLARMMRNKEQEKKEWASKNLPKSLDEAIIKMDAIPENEPHIYIEQQQYIDSTPKSLDEAIIKMDTNPENEPHIYTIEERQYIDNAPKSLDEAIIKMAETEYDSANNATYYKGMVPIDPDMYRLETTGTTQEDIAKIANELSKAEIAPSTDLEAMSEKLDQLMREPETISKVMETRMRKTSDFLYGWGDYDKNHVYTDLTIMSMLVSKGYDFSNFKVDLSTQVGANPDIVNLEGLLEYYDLGLIGKKSQGKNTQIPNPLNPQEEISAENLVVNLKTASTQLQSENNRTY